MAEGQNLLRLKLVGLPADGQEEAEEAEMHESLKKPDDPHLEILTWRLTARIPLQRSDKDQE